MLGSQPEVVELRRHRLPVVEVIFSVGQPTVHSAIDPLEEVFAVTCVDRCLIAEVHAVAFAKDRVMVKRDCANTGSNVCELVLYKIVCLVSIPNVVRTDTLQRVAHHHNFEPGGLVLC